jgi:hypothetical protein
MLQLRRPSSPVSLEGTVRRFAGQAAHAELDQHFSFYTGVLKWFPAEKQFSPASLEFHSQRAFLHARFK